MYPFEIRSIGLKGTARVPVGVAELRRLLIELFLYVNARGGAPAPAKKSAKKAKPVGQGRLAFDGRAYPTYVVYPGRIYRVERVNDAGNCFFECCARHAYGDPTRHMEMRATLAHSEHLKKSERLRVAKEGNYATSEDIQAMAHELGITIVLHECRYGAEHTEERTVVGGAAATLDLLFQYMPDPRAPGGIGHVQPLALI